jgi:hypothetical protein
LSPAESAQLVSESLLDAYPNVGVITAASSDQQAHEWSKIESGVFTHEVLSALLGAADVNGDRRIEYSEVQAFVAAANRGLADPRARPRVEARPPAADRHAVLIDLAHLKDVSFLRGKAGALGHFQVELGNGVPWLDAHLAPETSLWLALPRGTSAFLRTHEREAKLPTGHVEVALAALQFAPLSARARGSVEASLRDALFSTAFGPSYYAGFVDSTELESVAFSGARPKQDATRGRSSRARRAVAVTAVALAGGAGAAALVLGGLTIDRRARFDATSKQRDAHELAQEHEHFRKLTMAATGVALAAGVTSYLLWPRFEPVTRTAVLALEGRF